MRSDWLIEASVWPVDSIAGRPGWGPDRKGYPDGSSRPNGIWSWMWEIRRRTPYWVISRRARRG